MRQYIDVVQDVQGNALVGVSILVQNYVGGGNASIYSDNGLTPISNSTVTSGSDGSFSFFAADGDYNLVFSKNSTVYKTQSPVSLFDGAAQLTFSDTGTANTYAISNNQLEKALRSGLRISMLVANSNTGASTLQYNGLTAKSIILPGGSAAGLPSASLLVGGIYTLEYDGTYWELKTPSATTPFIAQTAAEAAAGVTPTNYGYAAGNVLRYGTNTTPGTTDMTAAFQAALNQRAQNGAPVYFPAGTYNQVSNCTYPANATPLHLYGDGIGATIIQTSNNIEQLTTSGASASAGMLEPFIEDLTFSNLYPVTAGAGSTHFHVRLTNSLRGLIRNVQFHANFSDTDYNVANSGGISFDLSSTYPSAFMNTVDTCWIDHCQLYMGTSDSTIQNSFVWGHPCQYSIKADNGNISVLGCPGIIGSQGKGGVWITGNGVNTKVSGNFFDGSNNIVNSGYGVFADQTLYCNITDNIFWRQWLNAIYLNTPVSFTISGNNFVDNGRGDSATSANNADILIDCIAFAPNANTITANSAYRGATRTNQGAFILERNSGANAVQNRYLANTVVCGATQYLNPAIVTLLGFRNVPPGSILIGNVGLGTESETFGTYTAGLSGVTGGNTVTFSWSKNLNTVTISTGAALTGTYSSSPNQISGVPAAAAPYTQFVFPIQISLAGVVQVGLLFVVNGSWTLETASGGNLSGAISIPPFSVTYQNS